MTYSVKEIYYTLQGEGANTGRPAVFLRFSGCNLWNGLELGRAVGVGGCSKWCDTDFVGVDGKNGGKYKGVKDLVDAVIGVWGKTRDCESRDQRNMLYSRPLVVCTGGEPLLQLDEALAHALRCSGFSVAVETNGTIKPPVGVMWMTVSPKVGADLVIKHGHELKLIYPQKGAEPELYSSLEFEHFFLQPCDGPDIKDNTAAAVKYCLEHPQWRLGLQMHKYVGLP